LTVPTREFQLENIGIDYVCDACGEGTMERFGPIVLTSNPPLFEHKCNKCGASQFFNMTYPATGYRRKVTTPNLPVPPVNADTPKPATNWGSIEWP
jgi:hypothetical protein